MTSTMASFITVRPPGSNRTHGCRPQPLDHRDTDHLTQEELFDLKIRILPLANKFVFMRQLHSTLDQTRHFANNGSKLTTASVLIGAFYNPMGDNP